MLSLRLVAALGCALLPASCTPAFFVDDAAAIRVTYSPADVAACHSLGNIQAVMDQNGGVDPLTAREQLQDQTASLGGNVALITAGSSSAPVAGIAYSCK
jgi:hypothetical protein